MLCAKIRFMAFSFSFLIAFFAHTSNFYEQWRSQKFEEICQKHEINMFFANKLQMLEGFKIVLVCDDSGSMSSKVKSGSDLETTPQGTRWDELKGTVEVIIDIASVLGQEGVDIYFLNRNGLTNVSVREQIDPFFAQKPSGYTPIAPRLENIFAQKVDGKRLVILATDGEPTDTYGNRDIAGFKNVLLYKRGLKDYVNIVACTDDDNTMSYLNNWDRNIPRLDVIDDYESEKKEIRYAQGSNFRFSKGDYVVKCMIGSVDPYFDKLDEADACHCILF
jgi:hypothetical protein